MSASRRSYLPHLLPVGALGIALPLISWCNIWIVLDINRWLRLAASDERGWALYTGLRLILFLALVWFILRLRTADSIPDMRSSASLAAPVKQVVTTGHKPGFDPLLGLRALAASMVLLGHYFMVVFPYQKPPSAPWKALYYLVRSCPWGGVWVFFTLSGYLMAKGFATKRYDLAPTSVFSFYRNRFLRIVPLYAGALILVAMLVSPAIFQPTHFWQLVEMLVFDYRGDLPMNPIGALWSVSTEVQFYILVPFLFAALALARRCMGHYFIGFPVLVLIAGSFFRRFISTHFFAVYYAYGYSPLLPNLDIFLAGMSMSLFSVAPLQKSTRRLLGFALPLLAGAIYCATVMLTHRYYRADHLADLQRFWVWAPSLTCLLAALYVMTSQAVGRVEFGERARKIALGLVTRAGMLTYALYVFHPQIYTQFRTSLLPATVLQPSQSFGYFPLVLFVVWLTAEAAYHFIERPFEQRKHVRGSALLNAP